MLRYAALCYAVLCYARYYRPAEGFYQLAKALNGSKARLRFAQMDLRHNDIALAGISLPDAQGLQFALWKRSDKQHVHLMPGGAESGNAESLKDMSEVECARGIEPRPRRVAAVHRASWACRYIA
jgi:hypothetical protein